MASSLPSALARRYTEGMDELFDATFLRKLEMLSLSAKRAFRGQMRGEQRSTRTGASVEFADYRQYNPGDDFRRIDWNAYARLDNLLLKLFREEEDLHLYLLVDGSASMNFGAPNKFDYVRRVAGALAYVALANSDRVSVYLLGGEEGAPPVRDSLGPRRGRSAVFEVFDFLRAAQPGGRTDLTAAVEFLLARRARPGLAVICSDLLLPEGFESAIRRLAYERFEPMLVHVMAPDELQPDLRGDLRLVDAESGAYIDVSPTPRVAALYQRHLQQFRTRIVEFARKHGVEYVFTSSDAPFEELVLRWMRQANVLS